jgi:transcriptional regulator with XRE-family HTH domain
MSMKSYNVNEIKEEFRNLLTEETEDEATERDAYLLMAGYLSEIERIQQSREITRRELAEKIKTSASYLTQVFRGDKPLNFITVAKIRKALKIRFDVTAKPISDLTFQVTPCTTQAQVVDGSFSTSKKNNEPFTVTYRKLSSSQEQQVS